MALVVFRPRAFSRFVTLPLACVMLAGATDLLHPREWDVHRASIAAHDADAHHWSASYPRPHTDGEHCFLCHWTRAFGSATSPAGWVVVTSRASMRWHWGVLLTLGRALASRLAARAPPLLSL